VPVASGRLVPLSELADIRYTSGPAKISRENAHRRVVVSVNVRERDLQSVINDIRRKIEGKVTLAPGNYIEYGGQFENLKNATDRLMIAVPVALLLIFIFLHFAFKSFKDAFMIYTAVPLATVGGVFLLWMRGMPFSVSAGVGFIALFGIAVLNGIVLIEHLKELQHRGMTDMRDLLLTGTRNRLRPVMLTAGAAAMGFLPMAVSTGAGAEVQRPLATVVIGGLVTSTMLTMIALPLMFMMFNNLKGFRLFTVKKDLIRKSLPFLFLLIPAVSATAQPEGLKLDEVISIALKNNREIAACSLKVKESRLLVGAAFTPEKTMFTYGYDENNIAANGHPLNVWGAEQRLGFPYYYSSERKLRQIELSIAQTELDLQKNELCKNASQLFFRHQLLLSKQELNRELDSLFSRLLSISLTRESRDDLSHLEALTIRAKRNHIALNLKSLENELESNLLKLTALMGVDPGLVVSALPYLFPAGPIALDSLPVFSLIRLRGAWSDALVRVEKGRSLPDFTANYFLGANRFDQARVYQGFEVGVALPLLNTGHRARIEAARVQGSAQRLISLNEWNLVKNRLKELEGVRAGLWAFLENYEASGRLLHEEIMRTALKSYTLGEIDFYRFVSSYETAVQVQVEYYENLCEYNSVSCEILYFSN